MGKVLGFHEVRLRDGVAGEELEEFVREEAGKIPFLKGWGGYLLKRRVNHSGHEYLIVWAADEERYPHGHPHALAECEEWRRRHADRWARWGDYMATTGDDIAFADYTIAAEF